MSDNKKFWSGKTGYRISSGRCSECGWSNFSYDNGMEFSEVGVRGYRCTGCKTIKPEAAKVGDTGEFFHPKTMGVMKVGKVIDTRLSDGGIQAKVSFDTGFGTHWTDGEIFNADRR